MTQVIGQVVDLNGLPLAGALVSAPGGQSATTDANGRFQISGIPTVFGDLIVRVTYTSPDNYPMLGASAPTAPVLDGVTDVGRINISDVTFEPDYGPLQPFDANGQLQRTLPFAFPFNGVARSRLLLLKEGILFLPAYATGNFFDGTVGTIYAFMDFLCTSIHINERLPNRYILTYSGVPTYLEGGSNTVQIQLFRNGRIVLAFKGITSRHGISMFGVEPSLKAAYLPVDYRTKLSFEIPPQFFAEQFFDQAHPFDLDNAFIVFTPTSNGGYSVRTILPPQLTPSTTLSGSATASAPQAAPTQLRASALRQRRPLSGTPLANAEVHVSSSGNPHYPGMTNTDAQGRFTLSGVPPGGISVEVWRDGALLARGSGISAPDKSGAEQLQVELVSPEVWPRD